MQKGALHKCVAKLHLCHPKTYNRRENRRASGKPGKEPQLRFVRQQEQGTTAALNAAGTFAVQAGSEETVTVLT